MSEKKRHLLPLIVFCFVFSACNLTQPSPGPGYQGGPAAWFDQPLPNSSYPLGPVQIVGHGSDPGGVAQFELSANGAPLDIPSPDSSNSLVTLSYAWIPSGPGTYQLQLRARNGAGIWSPYAETTVIVEAPATATPEPATPQVERISLSTDQVYFGLPSMIIVACGDKSVTIRFRAIDPGGIKVVVLFYRLQSQSSGDATEFASMAMTPIGQDLYQATLSPQSLFADSQIQSFGASWLQYQAVVQDNANQATARSQVYSDLALQVCTR